METHRLNLFAVLHSNLHFPASVENNRSSSAKATAGKRCFCLMTHQAEGDRNVFLLFPASENLALIIFQNVIGRE